MLLLVLLINVSDEAGAMRSVGFVLACVDVHYT